ncbi:Ribosomal large subunit pseudouridine synthase C [Candidatus Vidania fulgoroideae]|nr:Ribosomal large subunit pseudouridine synthase C [Candidatus Vidania fulgoroideae]
MKEFKKKYLFLSKKRNKHSEIKKKGYNLLGRLDYEVPGILFFTKKKKIFVFNKQYFSLVFGNFFKYKKVINVCNGKVSISVFKKIFFFNCRNISLIKIKLITGRKNQIRKQLNFLGFPIVSDKRFGDFNLNNFFSKKKIFLMNKSISFICYNYKLYTVLNKTLF